LDNNSNLISNIDLNDIEIKENNELREIITLNCPKENVFEKLSTVLTMDVSGSMYGGGLDIAQEAAMSWINKLFQYNDSSECAITSFSDYSYDVTDFTNSKFWLEAGINRLYPLRGTNYDEGFMGSNGGLYKAAKGKYKKILVFLSDGYPNFYPNESKIVEYAKQNGITIHAVIIGYEAPYLIKAITRATGGLYFEKIMDGNQALNAYNQILKISVVNKPCEIVWRSKIECGKIDYKYKPMQLTKTQFYSKPDELRARLDLSTKYINFGLGKSGYTYDTTITVRAINQDVKIDTIISNDNKLKLDFGDKQFPFVLKLGDSLDINIKYPYNSDESDYTSFSILSNTCEQTMVEFSIYNEKEPLPTARNGFGNIAILTEVNNIANMDFKGYNFGAGLQLYILKNVAVRLGYGLLQEKQSSLLTDRSAIKNEISYYSANLKFNVAVNENILGYIAPFLMYESGIETVEYLDKFTRANDLKGYSAGVAIGGEFFIYHNFSISLETVIGAKKVKTSNILGFDNKSEVPTSDTLTYFIKPKLNFIISYFIN